MARFPKAEAEIVALAGAIEAGLAANVAIFPAPPAAVVELTAAKDAYQLAANAVMATRAAAEAATTAKNDKLNALVELMKSDLRYAENTVNFDDDPLKRIGWGGRAAASALTPPGQVRLLEAPKQGEGWVFLGWKAPVEGGKPAAYRVMRRQRPDGAWEDVATAVVTESTLVEQPRMLELEYRIVAVNTAGQGEPSNTAMVVL